MVAQAQAQLGKMARDVARHTPLAEARAIPQGQLDDDIQANRAAQASVQVFQAAVQTARLNLGFTKVRSLIDGIAAIATAQVGDQVNPPTLLTTVSQVDPIRAYFSLSEDEYLHIASQLNRAVGSKGLWNTGPALALTLADGTIYPRSGAFLAADRQIDATTGTIRSDALVGYRRADEFRAAQEQLVRAADDARRLADVRYRGGASSYLDVLDSDTRLFSAELDLAQANPNELAAFVEIYRALGGGSQ